jgi:DNA-binding transcriptional LysR family regulator
MFLGGVDMDIKQLSYFVQICDNNSLTKTAKKLFMTQQALSKVIKNLEEELSVIFFSRSHSGVHLTKEGEYFYEKSRLIVQEYNRFETDIYNHFRVAHGAVSYAMTSGAMNTLSPEVLLDFQSEYPHVVMHRYNYPDKLAEQHLFDGQIEFAFMAKPMDEEKLAFVPIKSEKFLLLVRNDNLLASDKEVRFSDLADQFIITHPENTYIYKKVVDKCREAGFDPNIIFSSAEPRQLIKLLISGRGIYATVEHASEFVSNDEIIKIPFSNQDLEWQTGFAYKKDKQLSSSANVFINYVLNYFGKNLIK